MMKGRLLQALAWTVLALSAPPAAGQEVDAPETARLVQDLLAAQGGMQAWEESVAVEFDHVMFTPAVYAEGDTHWWASREVIEHGTLRAYAEWPIDGARLAHDGREVWSVGWKRPNAPDGMARIHYFLVFLPWLTQQDDARLTAGSPASLPGQEVESLVVDVAFGEGEPPFALFIDPDTHRLRGFRNRGSLHVIHRFGDADGLSIPIDWTTYLNGNVIGHHSVYHASLLDHFDESLLEAPPGAVRGSGAG
ncbi:MAG: hypothetical protein AAF389_10295 [Gemmatimonadota bacterium]